MNPARLLALLPLVLSTPATGTSGVAAANPLPAVLPASPGTELQTGGIAPGIPWVYEPSVAFTELGYSVSTAGDVNGDGFSDVIVGAHRADGAAGVDQGEALVFLGSPSGTSPFPNWFATSAIAGSRFGWCVSTAGDVNGDGYDDVAIGTSSSSVVYVYHGSGTGLGGAPATVLTGTAGEAFGFSVATAGDVNADGYDDLIVGAYAYGGFSIRYGRIALYLGSPGGLGLTPAWSDTGDVTNEYLGYSVAAAGDVNGDGFDDLVAGSYGYDPTGSNSIHDGRASCYAGNASGQPTRIWTVNGSGNTHLGESVAGVGDHDGDGYADIVVAGTGYQSNRGWAQLHRGSATGPSATPTITMSGSAAGERLGQSVATAGDIDGDGYADFLVGIPRRDANRGHVLLFHGNPNGSAEVLWSQPGGADSFFGQCVATAGDVNGDGFSDVLIGAPFQDNGQDNEGRAYVYRGQAGISSYSQLSYAESDLPGLLLAYGYAVTRVGDVDGDGYDDLLASANSGNVGRVQFHRGGPNGINVASSWSRTGQHSGERFGQALGGAGDVNGDGYDDFLIGAPGFDPGGAPATGRVHLYLGSAAGPGALAAWTANGVQPGEQFGAAVACDGDVNGDGYDDILIGSPKHDGPLTSAGKATLYVGSPAGPGASPAWTNLGVDAWLNYGHALDIVGDMNGDGFDDVAIGGPGFDHPDTTGSHLRIFFGQSAGALIGPTGVPGGNSSTLGSSVSGAGDVNGDGYADLLVGDAWFSGLNRTREGRALLFYGAGSGPLSGVDWHVHGNAPDTQEGHSVSGAGDVNADGYDDLILGAPSWDGSPPTLSARGRARIFLGSPTGPGMGPEWSEAGADYERAYGYSVAGAGDVNGDGYGDVVIGEPGYGTGVVPRPGRVRIQLGGDVTDPEHPGVRDFAYRCSEPDGTPVRPGSRIQGSGLRLHAAGQGAGGRSRVRLEWQLAPVGTPLASVSLVGAPDWSDTGPVISGLSAVSLLADIGPLAADSRYHFRYRTASRSPYFPHAHWLTLGDTPATLQHVSTGSVSAVEDPLAPPPSIALRAAPNPFHGSTLIRFENARAGRIRADLFDVVGRRVMALLDESRERGDVTIRWDGRLPDGSRAASGVYLLKVRASQGSGTTRLVRLGS